MIRPTQKAGPVMVVTSAQHLVIFIPQLYSTIQSTFSTITLQVFHRLQLAAWYRESHIKPYHAASRSRPHYQFLLVTPKATKHTRRVTHNGSLSSPEP